MPDQKRILIADDEQDILKVLSMRLRINGYEVVKAENGEEALNKIREANPDLLILDLMMPKMNGYEVCRMLKFDDKYKTLPIVILSALHEQKERDLATQAGCDAYFVKPFDLDLLLSKIKSLAG